MASGCYGGGARAEESKCSCPGGGLELKGVVQ